MNIIDGSIYRRMNFRAILDGKRHIGNRLTIAHNTFYVLNVDGLGQAGNALVYTHWTSTGVRPYATVADFFAVQLEYGIDKRITMTPGTADVSETIQKITPAPTFTIARG